MGSAKVRVVIYLYNTRTVGSVPLLYGFIFAEARKQTLRIMKQSMPAAPQNLPNRCSSLNTATAGVNFRLRLLKQWKIRIAYKQFGSKFPRRRTKPNTKRKTESYIFSGFGNFISRGWERKSSTTRFATGRFWPFTWKTSSVRKDKVNKWEFFLIGNYAHCFICNHDSTHYFHHEP